MKGFGSIETRRRFSDSYGLFLKKQRINNNESLEISDDQKRLWQAHDDAYRIYGEEANDVNLVGQGGIEENNGNAVGDDSDF